MKKSRTRSQAKPIRPDPNRYPKGWNSKRVEAVIAHYENQTDDEAIAEAEAAYAANDSVMMQVPLKLVPKVEKLIARAS